MPSWDPIWEHVFRTRTWGRYPPEELVRFVAGRFGKAADRSAVRLLEVGCGTGACCWYMAREGFRVTGLDGSSTALGLARQRLDAEGLAATFARGDLCDLPFTDGSFDGVVDICAIQQNRREAIARILRECRRVLKPGGGFFSMLLKEGSWGDGTGTPLEPGTWTDIPEGPYTGEGVTHFAREAELPDWLGVFSRWDVEVSTRTYRNRRSEVAHWIVTANA